MDRCMGGVDRGPRWKQNQLAEASAMIRHFCTDLRNIFGQRDVLPQIVWLLIANY